jgi:hypothetical protein
MKTNFSAQSTRPEQHNHDKEMTRHGASKLTSTRLYWRKEREVCLSGVGLGFRDEKESRYLRE